MSLLFKGLAAYLIKCNRRFSHFCFLDWSLVSSLMKDLCSIKSKVIQGKLNLFPSYFENNDICFNVNRIFSNTLYGRSSSSEIIICKRSNLSR